MILDILFFTMHMVPEVTVQKEMFNNTKEQDITKKSTQLLQVPTSSALYWPSVTKYQAAFERISTCRSFLNMTTYQFTSFLYFQEGESYVVEGSFPIQESDGG